MHIKEKVVIVTGASGGIGLAVARLLAQRGAYVVLAARSKDLLERVGRELTHSLPVQTDLRKPEDIKNLIEKTVAAFGRVDILINNAGQGLRASIETVPLKDYRAIMELNVFSVLATMQAVIPTMCAQGGGMILNISSMVSKNYFPMLGAYASTKYALNALSLTAREELAKDNIIVSVFHPKMTATDFGKNSAGEKYDSFKGHPGMKADTPEQVAERIADQIESEVAEGHM